MNTNGVISFLRPVGTYTPNPFPIANDARMIAPFWADIDTTRGGTVWYRETTNDTMLDRATDEVRAYFPDFFRFRASWDISPHGIGLRFLVVVVEDALRLRPSTTHVYHKYL